MLMFNVDFTVNVDVEVHYRLIVLGLSSPCQGGIRFRLLPRYALRGGVVDGKKD